MLSPAVAAARNALGLKTEIIGVVSARARTYGLSLDAGRVVEEPAETAIADGLAVSRANEDALGLMRNEISRVVQVSDEEIENAMRAVAEPTRARPGMRLYPDDTLDAALRMFPLQDTIQVVSRILPDQVLGHISFSDVQKAYGITSEAAVKS